MLQFTNRFKDDVNNISLFFGSAFCWILDAYFWVITMARYLRLHIGKIEKANSAIWGPALFIVFTNISAFMELKHIASAILIGKIHKSQLPAFAPPTN